MNQGHFGRAALPVLYQQEPNRASENHSSGTSDFRVGSHRLNGYINDTDLRSSTHMFADPR